MTQKILILGATNDLGLEIASKFNEGFELFLTGSNLNSIENLKKKFLDKNKKHFFTINFNQSFQENLNKILNISQSFDKIFLVAAFTPDNQLLINENEINETININLKFYINLLNSFNKIEILNNVHIYLISSISTSRPRKTNTIYTAMKIALESYLKGLRHFNDKKNMKLSIYRLGYLNNHRYKKIKTKLLPAVNCDYVANYIFRNQSKEIDTYFPFFWKIIALIIKLIPKKIFYKLNL